MDEKKTWTAAPTKAPSAAGAPTSLWADDSDALSAELVGGGTIDELARAAKENGVMMTLSFIPAAAEDDNKITKREALALGWFREELRDRAGAAAGVYPDPPEWIDLWEQALAATEDERNEDDG